MARWKYSTSIRALRALAEHMASTSDTIRKLGITGQRLNAVVEQNYPRLYHSPGNFVLNGKDIVNVAVVPLRPQLIAVFGTDQLCRNLHPPVRLADAALQNGAVSQLLPNFPCMLITPTKERGRAPPL